MPRKRLEPWLRDKLNTGEIPGLEWKDSSKQIWKMPWKANKETQVGEPDAVMLTKMARHLYKYKGDAPTSKEISEWKRKIRCSLTSIKGVEEMKDFHQLDRKTRMLSKVYRFTSADEQSASVHPANRNTSNATRNSDGNLKRTASAEQDGMLLSRHSTTKRQRLNPSPHNCGPSQTPAVMVGLSGSRISTHQFTPSSSRDYFLAGPPNPRENAENQNTNITGQEVMMNTSSNSNFLTPNYQTNVSQTAWLPCSYESAIMGDDDDLRGSEDDMTGMATNGTGEPVPLTLTMESPVPAISSKAASDCQTTILCSSATPEIIDSVGARSFCTTHLQSTTSKMYIPEAQTACPISPPVSASCATPSRTYSEDILPQCTTFSSNLSLLEIACILSDICSLDMTPQFITSNSESSPLNAPQGMKPKNTASLGETSLFEAPDGTNLLSISLVSTELQYPFSNLSETEKKVDDTKLSCNEPEPSKDNAPQEFQNTASYEETAFMDAPGAITSLGISLVPKNAESQYPSNSLAVTEKNVDDMKLSCNEPEPSKDNAPQEIDLEFQNTASYEEISLMDAPGGTTLLSISLGPRNAELQYPSGILAATEKKVGHMKLSLIESEPSIDDATMAISIYYYGNCVMETPIKNKGIRLCYVPNDHWRESITSCKDPEQYGPCNFPVLEFPAMKRCLALTPEQQGVVKKVLEGLPRGISLSLEGNDIYACRHSNAVAFHCPPENEH